MSWDPQSGAQIVLSIPQSDRTSRVQTQRRGPKPDRKTFICTMQSQKKPTIYFAEMGTISRKCSFMVNHIYREHNFAGFYYACF